MSDAARSSAACSVALRDDAALDRIRWGSMISSRESAAEESLFLPPESSLSSLLSSLLPLPP